MYGLGRTCPEQQASIFSADLWRYIWSGCPDSSAIAPPRAPAGPLLTQAPASAEAAQAAVDALLNQQLVDQQALNAAAVQSSALDLAAGAAASAGEAVAAPFSVPGWVWLAGAGVAGIVLLSFVGGRSR